MPLTIRTLYQKVKRLFGGDDTVGWSLGVTLVDENGVSVSREFEIIEKEKN